jgi:hypothetical protein
VILESHFSRCIRLLLFVPQTTWTYETIAGIGHCVWSLELLYSNWSCLSWQKSIALVNRLLRHIIFRSWQVWLLALNTVGLCRDPETPAQWANPRYLSHFYKTHFQISLKHFRKGLQVQTVQFFCKLENIFKTETIVTKCSDVFTSSRDLGLHRTSHFFPRTTLGSKYTFTTSKNSNCFIFHFQF